MWQNIKRIWLRYPGAMAAQILLLMLAGAAVGRLLSGPRQDDPRLDQARQELALRAKANKALDAKLELWEREFPKKRAQQVSDELGGWRKALEVESPAEAKAALAKAADENQALQEQLANARREHQSLQKRHDDAKRVLEEVRDQQQAVYVGQFCQRLYPDLADTEALKQGLREAKDAADRSTKLRREGEQHKAETETRIAAALKLAAAKDAELAQLKVKSHAAQVRTEALAAQLALTREELEREKRKPAPAPVAARDEPAAPQPPAPQPEPQPTERPPEQKAGQQAEEEPERKATAQPVAPVEEKAPQAEADDGDFVERVVREGETMWGILKELGVENNDPRVWEVVAAKSGIEDPQALQGGQKLRIPKALLGARPAQTATPGEPQPATDPEPPAQEVTKQQEDKGGAEKSRPQRNHVDEVREARTAAQFMEHAEACFLAGGGLGRLLGGKSKRRSLRACLLDLDFWRGADKDDTDAVFLLVELMTERQRRLLKSWVAASEEKPAAYSPLGKAYARIDDAGAFDVADGPLADIEKFRGHRCGDEGCPIAAMLKTLEQLKARISEDGLLLP